MSQAAVDLLLRGYRAFVAGDLAAIEGMLDPEVEWIGGGEVPAIAERDDVLEILRDRLSEEYSVTVDRCIGVGEDVVVSMRFSRIETDPTDERPLESRRSYLVGRYAGIVTMHDGRVTRVVEYPHLAGALAAAGLDEDAPWRRVSSRHARSPDRRARVGAPARRAPGRAIRREDRRSG